MLGLLGGGGGQGGGGGRIGAGGGGGGITVGIGGGGKEGSPDKCGDDRELVFMSKSAKPTTVIKKFKVTKKISFSHNATHLMLLLEDS